MNAGNLLMTWVTVLIIVVVSVLLLTVCQPTINVFSNALASFIPNSTIEYAWLPTIFNAGLIIISITSLIWGVLCSIKSEYQSVSDFGEL